jgi:hypothetical protein
MSAATCCRALLCLIFFLSTLFFSIFILSTSALSQNAPLTDPTPPTSSAPAPTPTTPSKLVAAPATAAVSPETDLKAFFESKVKIEWDAFQSRDKKAYEALLDDDFQSVEVDNRGERNKIQAVNEIANQNGFTYNLWGFKVLPLGSDGELVIYESTLQFAPGAQMRYLRVYVSEVWVKRAGQWKELHYQETHVK